MFIKKFKIIKLNLLHENLKSLLVKKKYNLKISFCKVIENYIIEKSALNAIAIGDLNVRIEEIQQIINKEIQSVCSACMLRIKSKQIHKKQITIQLYPFSIW